MPLQANWDGTGLHVWGYSADHAQPLAHEPLRGAVAEITGDALLASAGTEAQLNLWLPSRDGSAEEQTPPEGVLNSDHAKSLSIATVPTLRFAPADATDLLATCPPATSGAACADSMRFWGTLSHFVMRHITEHQFFPDLELDAEQQPIGLWRLMIDPNDGLERLERFAASMPPVCRAMADARVEEDAEVYAGQLIESFLLATTNAVIRRDVTHDPFFAQVHQRAAEPDASPEVRWLSALLGVDNVVRADAYTRQVLTEQVRAWVSQLDHGRADAPWPLGFELEEPEESDTDDDEAADLAISDAVWRLKLQLDPPGEDIEPMDAAELWSGSKGGAILGRRIVQRREQFRAELVAAAEVCPPLQRLLDAPAPSEMELSTPEAHLFMRQWTPQLEARGYRVVLPEWAQRGDSTPGLLLNVRPLETWPDDDELDPNFALAGPDQRGIGGAIDAGAGRFGLDSLVDFDWRVAVGDLRLSPDEFGKLVNSRSPLVRFRGQWLQIDVDAADRAARALEKSKKGKITLAEAFRTAFVGSSGLSTEGVPVIGLTGSSWVQQLLEQTPSARLKGLEQPTAFVGQLRPYQLRGLDWLWFLHRLGIGGCLADDMGLGKTIQLISLLLQDSAASIDAKVLRREECTPFAALPGDSATQPETFDASNDLQTETIPASHAPTLLFAPTSVIGNWAKELSRFAPALRVLVHHGPERMRGDALNDAVGRHDVVITTYALAHRDAQDLAKPAWRRLVLDEAQKVKNPYAASTQAIRALAQRVPHRVAMTGTPVENRLSELWSIMEVLNPGLLGSAADFREQFAVPIEKLADKEQAERLRKLIRPFVLRRVKDDPQVAVDLPAKMEMKVYCNLSPEQAAMYERITAEMLGQVAAADGIKRRALVLAALTRLKQVCDHPALVTKETDRNNLDGRSGKCERIVEMLEEVIEEGDAALVFTQFKQMGDLLEKMITDRLRVPVQFLHGGTPAKKRDEMIDHFQKPDGETRIFLLSLRAGGLGLNLTRANHVFHFDRWWNPAVEQQATDRAHRIGQTRRVQVHKFVCVGTVEERIDQLLTEKLALADRIVSSGDDWLTNMSTDELRKALQLQDGAVTEF